MKKAICTIFCFTVVFYIIQITTSANDFSDNAISVFQELRKLNEESRAAFMSGNNNFQKEKGPLLIAKKDEFTAILKTLPAEYCSGHQTDLLKEFIKTLINTNDEYPTYVFAELYACDPDTIIKEILSLTPEDQKKICEDLNYGFKNIAYKTESLPNFKELKGKLEDLKGKVRSR